MGLLHLLLNGASYGLFGVGGDVTEEQLNEIEQRAANATPGPWATNVNAHPVYVTQAMEDLGICIMDGLMGSRGPDAMFIVYAREDIPALIAEVRRLRKQCEMLRRGRV